MHPAVVQLGSVSVAFSMLPDLVQCNRLNRFAVGFAVALGFACCKQLLLLIVVYGTLVREAVEPNM